MLTYVQIKTGRTQQVHERETIKRAILERSGWRLQVRDMEYAKLHEQISDNLDAFRGGMKQAQNELNDFTRGWNDLESTVIANATGIDLDHYDALNVREAIAYLDSLNLDDYGKRLVAEYEVYEKNRATVLKWLEP